MFHRPWVDKYRPKKIANIIEQDEVRNILKKTLETKNFPHMIFYGPAGCGKTSCAIAFALELYGPQYVNENVIELNASDESGINIVREKITTFARSKVSQGDTNYPSPPYKFIILDEADAMTNDAQSALRKIMESLSHNTRFCFICNYINQIIHPIISRCMKFRFKSISIKALDDKLQIIADNEKMEVSKDVIHSCSLISRGDARKAIMLLQSLNYFPMKTKEYLYDLANEIPDEIINNLLNKKYDEKTLLECVSTIKRNGYSIKNLIEKINMNIIYSNENDEIKSDICMKLTIFMERLLNGGDEEIQLMNVIYLLNYRFN
jgi:replication factor C subunit 2/4